MRYIIVALMLWCGVAYASDRVNVQVQFKKALWTCPQCGLEDVEDRPMEGGASYEHTCKNGHTFNQSGPNMKEYNGCITYPKDEYDTIKVEDIVAEKTKRCDEWIYEVKNPKPYVEPTEADLTNMINDHMRQVEELGLKLKEKTTPEKMVEVGNGVIEKGEKIKE